MPDHTVESTLAFIREQALPKAAKAVEHISLIEVPEDDQKPSIVTIGRNTALEARISLEHDGTLRALDEHASTINLIHPGPKGSTRFDTIHKTVQRRARHALSYELASHLGITRNTALRNNTTTARRPLNIYMDKKVQKEMDRTAKIIAKEHLPQGCSDPGAHGYSILPSLMPKHKVKSALNIIGRRATIAHMGCPAHAGIDRARMTARSLSVGLPRPRGDRPHGDAIGGSRGGVAPPTRG